MMDATSRVLTPPIPSTTSLPVSIPQPLLQQQYRIPPPVYAPAGHSQSPLTPFAPAAFPTHSAYADPPAIQHSPHLQHLRPPNSPAPSTPAQLQQHQPSTITARPPPPQHPQSPIRPQHAPQPPSTLSTSASGTGRKHLTTEERQRVRTLHFDARFSRTRIVQITGYTESQVAGAIRAESAAVKPRSGRPKVNKGGGDGDVTGRGGESRKEERVVKKVKRASRQSRNGSEYGNGRGGDANGAYGQVMNGVAQQHMQVQEPMTQTMPQSVDLLPQQQQHIQLDGQSHAPSQPRTQSQSQLESQPDPSSQMTDISAPSAASDQVPPLDPSLQADMHPGDYANIMYLAFADKQRLSNVNDGSGTAVDEDGGEREGEEVEIEHEA